MSALVHDFIFAHTTNAILIADASGLLEAVNPAAAALLGMAAAAIIGLPPTQAFAALPSLVSLFAEAASAEVTLPGERLAAGRAETLEDGRRVVLLEDVTVQRALDARRDALSQRIAHDLRNPVAALIGYVDLADSSGDLSDDQYYFIDRARSTAMKFYAVIGDMVDLAWIEADMPLLRTEVDLRAAIVSVVETLTPRGRDRSIVISTTLEASLAPTLGDPDSLRSVVYKLLENAILYSGDGKLIDVRAWTADDSVFCSVSDHGIGIAPDELDFIFDRLYRSRDPRVADIPGGGLGLTTARAVVQHSGGSLHVESALDNGSTFTLRLPAAPA